MSSAPGNRSTRLAGLLGPAFVASIAYVDPGNVAANMSAGADFGYLLVWVLVAANAMAVLVQYLSAKLGTVSGRSLPEHLGASLPRTPRILYWAQAEAVAAATDVAEVIGGAVALQLLFGLPLLAGALLTGAASTLLLSVQDQRGQRPFEIAVLALLVLITTGFVVGLFFSPFDARAAAHGLVPRFEGSRSVVLASSMLGATIMPHAIYLHSRLAVDRHGTTTDEHCIARLLRAARWDVALALVLAGGVNIAMLLLAASALHGRPGVDTLPGAHAAISDTLGSGVATAFALGLFVSGLASTSVGCYAGDAVMRGMLHTSIPLGVRRALTMLPAIVVIALGADATAALVTSQVILSLGIPFALVPLLRLTSDPRIMGRFANGRRMRLAAGAVTIGVIGLNLALLGLQVRSWRWDRRPVSGGVGRDEHAVAAHRRPVGRHAIEQAAAVAAERRRRQTFRRIDPRVLEQARRHGVRPAGKVGGGANDDAARGLDHGGNIAPQRPGRHAMPFGHHGGQALDPGAAQRGTGRVRARRRLLDERQRKGWPGH